MSKVPFGAKRSDILWLHPEQLVLITEESDPLYDPRVHLPVNSSLVKNILYEGQGVIEPIIITKRVADDGEPVPVVVAGRQRTKAAREACEQLEGQGLKPLLVPCIVRRGSDESLFATSVSENEQRTADSPIDKAKKVLTMRNFGQEWNDICAVFGCSEQTAKSWLELLDLPAEERDAVHKRKMPVKTAKKRAAVKEKNPAATKSEIEKAGRDGKGELKEGRSRRRVRTLKEVEGLRELLLFGNRVDLDEAGIDVPWMFKWMLGEVEMKMEAKLDGGE